MAEVTDPEVALAITYAPAATRPALLALFSLDARLGGIVATTTEPMIGMMRLAWWREALEKLDHDDAPAEPLLQDLKREVLTRGVTGTTLANIEDGWTALIDGEPDPEAMERHGRERGANLFRAAGTLLGGDDARLHAAGALWALSDLAYGHGDATIRDRARAQAATIASGMPSQPWPSTLRPLAMLAALAARDATAATRRQGHPGRLMRMLALRITGR
jgi:15-cis-phytoene synthase